MSNLFPYFPVFLDLAGRSVVFLAADARFESLTRALLASGASVGAYDPAPCDAMRALAPALRLRLRRWRAADLEGSRLVVAATSEPRLARARLAAHAAGAIFHVLDAPDLSDVALGGVTARGALAVGVAAQGAHPALAEVIRERIDQAMPRNLSEFLSAASRARGAVEARIGDADVRARFWRELGAAAFEADLDGPAAWDGLIAARLAELP